VCCSASGPRGSPPTPARSTCPSPSSRLSTPQGNALHLALPPPWGNAVHIRQDPPPVGEGRVGGRSSVEPARPPPPPPPTGGGSSKWTAFPRGGGSLPYVDGIAPQGRVSCLCQARLAFGHVLVRRQEGTGHRSRARDRACDRPGVRGSGGGR